MTDRLVDLLELRSSILLDLDSEGRVLVGNDDSGTTQLVELVKGEGSRALTATNEPCTGRYLSASRQVVISTDDGGTERAQLWLLDAEDPAAPWRPIAHDPAYIHSLLDVAPDHVVYATNRRNGVDFDVIRHSVSSGEEQVVWDGGGWVDDAAISPNGRRVALHLLSLLPASSQLLLADLDSGRVEVITEPDQPGHWSAPHWLGDDLLVSSSDAGVEFHSVRAFDVGQGAWTVLLDADDQDRTGIPSPDGQRMAVVSRNDGVDRLEVRALQRVDGAPELGATTEVTLPGAGVVDFRTPLVWSPDSSAFGFTFQSPVSAPEVYVWSGDEAAERRTVSNDAATTADLVVPVSHRVSTPDGERVPVFVLPGRHTDGSAVVLIHGGPEAAAVRGWNPIIAGLALAGHTVVVPNVRGSAGYGRRWISLDDVDKRLDSVADLAAIHAWLPEIGVDQHRVALYGASYGGYMVLAGLAFQPELWAAGVDVVGISSLVTFLRNTSPYRRAYREKEYGRLDRDLEMLEAASPINRVNEIAAPLFVIHGANDPRVPLSEAEQLVAAVRSRGLECELHVYADEGHGLVKRTNRLDALPKAFSFLARHLDADC